MSAEYVRGLEDAAKIAEDALPIGACDCESCESKRTVAARIRDLIPSSDKVEEPNSESVKGCNKTLDATVGDRQDSLVHRAQPTPECIQRIAAMLNCQPCYVEQQIGQLLQRQKEAADYFASRTSDWHHRPYPSQQ